MSKRYFIFGYNRGDNWEEHAWKVHHEGVNRDGAAETPTEVQTAGAGQRVRHLDAAIGLDSQDAHMAGDRVVTVAENPDGKGDIIQTVERYSDSGKFMGSYEVVWEKTGNGHHTLARTRRIFT